MKKHRLTPKALLLSCCALLSQVCYFCIFAFGVGVKDWLALVLCFAGYIGFGTVCCKESQNFIKDVFGSKD
jgi:hypothetical protein